MGLDICVKKIVDKSEAKESEFGYDYIRLIDDEGNYINNFPIWTKEFEYDFEEDWYDWKKFKEETGIDVKDSDWISTEYGERAIMTIWPHSAGKLPEVEDFKNGDNIDWNAWREARKPIITIDLKKVPTYKKNVKILYTEEVGYQRRGLNKKFYDDYDAEKIGYYVWSKEELVRYKRDYCDDYPAKQNFQENIINNFEDGRCVCEFSW